jgi:TrpR-related protein YerC/YecD
MSENKKNEIDNLYELIPLIQTKDECRALFEDLCTYKEIEAMAQRLHAARLLLDGVTYEQIIEQTGISSATLSRVSKCVKYGEGYKNLLSK